MPKLTPKQQAFVNAYAGPARGNATEAARIAGYSEKTARQMGAENLSKPAIASAIAAIAREVQGHAFLDARERQIWLARVAAGESVDSQWTEKGPKGCPAEMKERLKACDQLNKMQGVYTQKHEVAHTGAKVEVYVPVNPRIPPAGD